MTHALNEGDGRYELFSRTIFDKVHLDELILSENEDVFVFCFVSPEILINTVHSVK